MKKIISLLICIISIFSMTYIPHNNIKAKEHSENNDFFSDFTSMIREYDDSFDDVILNKNELTEINDVYMISDQQFTNITGDQISIHNNNYLISNDDYEVELNLDDNTFKVGDDIISSQEDFIKSENSILIPFENLAINLGYEISSNDNNYILSRPFATKRIIIDCNDNIDILNAVAYARLDDLHIIQFDSEKSAKEAFDYYSLQDNIDGVAVDMVVKIAETEGATNSYNSWGASYIGVDEYLVGINSADLEDVVVAVIDTGIDHDHYLLEGRIVEGGVNLSEENDLDANFPYEDGHKHGTHVSGIIADLTPSNVKILPIKALKSDGKGLISSILSGIQLCIEYKNRTENPMNIVAMNLSLGGESSIGSNIYNNYSSWIDSALNNEILSIVAAGNETQDCINVCPANIENAITVSALKEENGNLVFDNSYSNYGAYVDLCAPGTKILSGILNNQTAQLSGTSMATPHVSAMVALLLSNTNTNYTCTEVEELLIATAIDLGVTGKDIYYGYGCVNIAQGYANIIDSVVFSDTTLYHEEEFELTLTCDTVDSVIFYTLDGTTPNTTSSRYTTPIIINTSCKVSAIAYTFNNENEIIGASAITSQNYSFNNITPESYFTITSDGIITGYTGSFSLVGIPNTINGIKPIAIYDNVFENNILEQIIIPDSIVYIGDYAFAYCSNLTQIEANGVLEISKFAFYCDTSLTTISFNSVQTIEAYAFYLCYNITNLSLPSVTIIKHSAFGMNSINSQLSIVKLPQVKTLCNNVFYNCSSITNIEIPNIQLIGSLAFYNCNGIISINATNLEYLGNSAFYRCTSLNEINIPIIKTIGSYAFYDNTNLQKITISRYLSLIGNDSFYNTNGNLKFYIYAGNDYIFNYLQENGFPFTILNESNFLDYTLENNEITIAGYSYTNDEIIISEYIDEYPVTKIASNVFKNSNKIYSINSTTLKYIDDEAFYDCPNLRYINTPNIEIIGSKAFYNCPNLSTAKIDNVETINSNAFVNTPKLSQLTFNTNILTIGDYAIGYNYDESIYTINESFIMFCELKTGEQTPEILSLYANNNNIQLVTYNCRAFDIYFMLVTNTSSGTTAWITFVEGNANGTITIPSNVTVDGHVYEFSTIDSSAFENCSFITQVNLPNTIKTIGNYAFADCISLKKINLENVVNFGSYAFSNCLSLEEVNLSSTQNIPNNLFYNCRSLRNVSIPLVNTIGISSFENCYNLQTLNFTSDYLKTINSRAFYNNYKLELKNLNSLTTLGTLINSYPTTYTGEVFVNCKKIEKLYLKNIINMGSNLFTGSNVTQVYIGKKLENISNAITDTDNITIYGYEGTTAEYYANNYKNQYSATNNIDFIILNEFAINSNLPSQTIRVQKDNDLYLTISALGNDISYYFYSTTNDNFSSTLISKDKNSVKIDTSNTGTYYYYYLVRNWDDSTLTSNITKIEVLETSQSYVINIGTDGNGSVSPNGQIVVAVGEIKTFVITPNENYRFYKLSIDGEDKSSIVSNNTFTISNLYSNIIMNIEIEFELDEYNININSSSNGISPTNETILSGTTKNLEFTANPHYHISSFIVNNDEIEEAIGKIQFTYIISSISKNYDIKVIYSIDKFTLTIAKTGNGELSTSGIIKMNYGDSKLIEFFPQDGYKVGKVILDDNIDLGSISSYTIANISENHTLQIEFVERKYNIVLNSNSNQGNIIINGTSNDIDYGTSRVLTITPKDGYLIDKVYVNGELVQVKNNEITLNKITDDLNIEVTYKEDLDITITRPIINEQLSQYGIYVIVGIVGLVFLTLFITIICKKKKI